MFFNPKVVFHLKKTKTPTFDAGILNEFCDIFCQRDKKNRSSLYDSSLTGWVEPYQISGSDTKSKYPDRHWRVIVVCSTFYFGDEWFAAVNFLHALVLLSIFHQRWQQLSYFSKFEKNVQEDYSIKWEIIADDGKIRTREIEISISTLILMGRA